MSQEHERKAIRLSAIIIIVGRCVSIGFIKLYEIAAVYEVICIHLLASVDHLLSIKMSVMTSISEIFVSLIIR